MSLFLLPPLGILPRYNSFQSDLSYLLVAFRLCKPQPSLLILPVGGPVTRSLGGSDDGLLSMMWVLCFCSNLMAYRLSLQARKFSFVESLTLMKPARIEGIHNQFDRMMWRSRFGKRSGEACVGCAASGNRAFPSGQGKSPKVGRPSLNPPLLFLLPNHHHRRTPLLYI